MDLWNRHEHVHIHTAHTHKDLATSHHEGLREGGASSGGQREGSILGKRNLGFQKGSCHGLAPEMTSWLLMTVATSSIPRIPL